MAEATSALDLSNERAMYEALADVNVTYVSVGHRPSLLAFHTHKLVLRGPGALPSLVSTVGVGISEESLV
jgi:vitamin B12/bleomycin/antimicrobial peptide transport system ATP-binding/permease protein